MFAAIIMVVLFAMVAFAIDLGYLTLARTETQRSADATAHAAILEFARNKNTYNAMYEAESRAVAFAPQNEVLGSGANVTPFTDVQVGRYEFATGQTELLFDDPSRYNAVRVRVRRTDEKNGEVPFFFGMLLGKESQAVEASAISALIRNVSGFEIPGSGENVPMLPVTISERLWDHGIRHDNFDDWSIDPLTGDAVAGSDGIPEIKLFPVKSQSPGNLGTVNIGTSANSTSYISKQIREGLTQSDLDFHGGSIELNSNGELHLTGNTGLSAAMENDFSLISGEPRIIPVYRKVTGKGDNARFTIVKFVAVQIMSAVLTGGQKSVVIQPAKVTFDGSIQGSSSGISEGVYSSPRLVN